MGVGKRKPLSIVGGKVHWPNNINTSKKQKLELPYDSANPLWESTSRATKL